MEILRRHFKTPIKSLEEEKSIHHEKFSMKNKVPCVYVRVDVASGSVACLRTNYDHLFFPVQALLEL